MSLRVMGGGGGGSKISTGIYVPSDWGARGGWKTSRQAASSRPVNVVFDGDSIFQGQGTSNNLTKSPAWAVVNALRTAYGDGGSGFHSVIDCPGISFAGAPTSWTVPVGTVAAAFLGLNDCSAVGQSNGTKITNANVSGTSIDVLFDKAGGAFSVNIDGAGDVAVPRTPPTFAIGRYTVTGLAPGAHTVTITQTTASGMVIFGIVGRNATGILGWNMSHWGRASGAGGTGSPLADALWDFGPSPSTSSFPGPVGGWSTAFYTYANLFGTGLIEIVDNVMTTGNPTFTSPVGVFAAPQVGCYVYYVNASLWVAMGTVQSVNSPTSITCTANASQTVSNTGLVILPQPGHPIIPQTSIPDLVVTGLSINDLALSTTGAALAGNVRTRWDYAKQANPDCDLIAVLNAKGAHTDPGFQQHQYAREIKALCEEYGAAMVNFDSLSKNSTKYWAGQGYWSADQIHPNDAGSAFLSSTLLSICTS